MHVDTMSRSPIGMYLPLDQQPTVSSNSHAFPPFPSPESECIPQWLQFDSQAAMTYYPTGSLTYGTSAETPMDSVQTINAFPSNICGDALLELEGTPCVESWEEERKPLPSFPVSLGRAKRRALDLACITRASATGLHHPYPNNAGNYLQSFSPPPPSGCFGHLSASDRCWADQLNGNQVVVSQNEGLCMLVDSQETYTRNEDYCNSDSNMVVMDMLSDNHHQQSSFAENYSCLLNGVEGGVKVEEEGDGEGKVVVLERLADAGGWEESEEDEEEVEEEVEDAEEAEEEEEEDEKSVQEVTEEEIVERRRRRRRGGWKRGRRRKDTNDSDGDASTLADDVFLTGEEDGDCTLPNIPTALVCRWSDCNAIFGDQSALVRHIEKTHVDARSRGGGSGGSAGRSCNGSQGSAGSSSDEFACHWHLCPRRTRPFNARYKLLIHMRVHSGDKPNKCPYEGCPKAFSRLENLKIHQRSHTGERPYSCQFPLCPKAFSNSSDRAKHQRTHFDTKPYACQVAGCSKRYTDPSSLRKHVKNHSPKDQTQARRKAKSVDATPSPSQSHESKFLPSTPPAVPYPPPIAYQDYSSEVSSSSNSIKENYAADREQFLECGNSAENISNHQQESVEENYASGEIIGYPSQEAEDELFFDCFQSLESVRPLLNNEKEITITADLQNPAQFELSLDLDCGEVQQDFLEIGVLEKWGVTGTNMVECCTTDDTLDGDFLTIS